MRESLFAAFLPHTDEERYRSALAAESKA